MMEKDFGRRRRMRTATWKPKVSNIGRTSLLCGGESRELGDGEIKMR